MDQSSYTDMMLTYSNNKPGFIVIPLNYNKGWHAYRNGEEINIYKHLDIMPAIPVLGHDQVRFTYRPDSHKRWLLFSMSGVFIYLLFIICTCRKSFNTVNSL
jgi:uncharacterized membrane protein YfhO